MFKNFTWNTSYKYCWKQYKVSCRFLSKSKLRSKYLCEVGLCEIVVISIQYNSFEVNFWITRTFEFRIKKCSVVVKCIDLVIFNDIVVWHLQFASIGNTNCFVIHICVCLRVFQSLITQFLSTNHVIKVILFNENLLHKTGLLLIWINLLNLKSWFSMQEGTDRFTVNFFPIKSHRFVKWKEKNWELG